MSDRHVALIVEDDPMIAAIEKELVASMGHACIHVSTLEEARVAIAAGGYCYVLLDMQIPADAISNPNVGCGETVLRLVRRAAPHRTASGRHVLPILVITSYGTKDADFISKMYDMDANGFIAKPFGARLDLVLDKIRAALARAEREDHDACGARQGTRDASAAVEGGAGARASEVAPAGDVVRIVIDGVCGGGRTDVVVNGVRGSLQDVYFVVFLNLVCALLKTPGAWIGATKLGMARNANAPSRVRAGFKGLVPEGFAVVETQKLVGFRLNPGIVIEGVEWGRLTEHPQSAVKKIAAEWAKG